VGASGGDYLRAGMDDRRAGARAALDRHDRDLIVVGRKCVRPLSEGNPMLRP